MTENYFRIYFYEKNTEIVFAGRSSLPTRTTIVPPPTSPLRSATPFYSSAHHFSFIHFLSIMGRGPAWSNTELDDLAKAFVRTIQDPIVGTDQISGEFYIKLYEEFRSLAPPNADPKPCKYREVRPTRARWESAMKDISAFRSVVSQVRALRLTGNHTDDKLLSMCIEKHLKKRETVSQDAKEYPHNRWTLHLAYKILRTVPKFPGNEVEDPFHAFQHSLFSQQNRFNNQRFDEEAEEDALPQPSTPQPAKPQPATSLNHSVPQSSSTPVEDTT